MGLLPSFESSYKMGLIPWGVYSKANFWFWHFLAELSYLTAILPCTVKTVSKVPRAWFHLEHPYPKAFGGSRLHWRFVVMGVRPQNLTAKNVAMELKRSLCSGVLQPYFFLLPFFHFSTCPLFPASPPLSSFFYSLFRPWFSLSSLQSVQFSSVA